MTHQNPGHFDYKQIMMVGTEKFAARMRGRRYSSLRLKGSPWRFKHCREHLIKCARVSPLKADSLFRERQKRKEAPLREERKNHTLKRIADDVCKESGFNMDQLRGQCRQKPLVAARALISKRAYEAGFTMPRIGQFMHRDHTTILHHLKMFRDEE